MSKTRRDMWKLNPEQLRVELERKRSSAASKHRNRKRYNRAAEKREWNA